MKIYIAFFLLLPLLFFGQTQSENYIKTTTYKKANLGTLSTPAPEDAKVDITYFDGLGRPVENIAKQQSNSGNDIIMPIKYDIYGRQTIEYLPFASTQTNAAYVDPVTLVPNLIAQYKTNYGTVNDNPFNEKQLEASPLNRVLQQAAPGNDWVMSNNHTVKIDYQTNVDNEVKLFTCTAIWSATLGLHDISLGNSAGTVFYAANQLYKTITKDENWLTGQTYPVDHTTEEFKDKEGRVVLKRTYDLGVSHDTYYVYDSYGNLIYVIPPKANGSITATVLDDLCYQYKYDFRNRLVEKKLPGKQWEFIVYDKFDRIAATGPAFSPFNDNATVGWLITKYDAFNRPVLTGWATIQPATALGRKALQDAQDTATVLNESKTVLGTIDGVSAYYSNNVLPTSFKLLNVKYYDNYTFLSTTPAITIPTTVEGQNVSTTLQVRGLPTATWSRIPTSSVAILGETTAIFYDDKARAIRTYIQNYLSGYTYEDSNLDFTGVPQYTIKYHKRLSGSIEIKTKEAFTYSTQGRLTIHTNQINTDTPQLLASNTYDELGQLISKKTGNIQGAIAPLQNINFNYNIRGWMTDINNTTSLAQSGDPKDLFAFKINYNTSTSGISGVKALYNGNIAETYWNTADVQRGYGYKYDNLNRLTDATFQKATVTPNVYVTTNAYNENLTYDKNGNIMSLLRNGSSETQTQIDNLVYNYGPTNSTNQLTKVSDSAPASSKVNGFGDSAANTVDDYSYDANGNMTKDNNKNITAITYNHLNLPTKITFLTAGNIVYIYNAEGQKVQKIVTDVPSSATTTTDYLDGYQYLNTVLQFFPTAEGYVESITPSSYKYVFQYKDHLGNVRLSYKDSDGNGAIISSEIMEENNYYPFGLKHMGYGPAIVSTSPALKYKYNRKEFQDELGLGVYDYGARNYDAAIGRWMNMDAMAEKYNDWSPYNYAINNPINVIDPDGNDIYLLTWFSSDRNGGQTGHAGIAIDNYKTQNKKDSNGNDVLDKNGKIVTEQVKDGTMTYYDLWPAKPVDQDELQSGVNPDYNGKVINNLNDLKFLDVSVSGEKGKVSQNGEGRAADGIVQIPTNATQDSKAKATAKAEIASNKDYNGCFNNCSTFSQKIINSVFSIDASQTIKPAGVLRVIYSDAKTVAPNNLYNAALKLKGATNIKGPSSVTAKPYLEYFGKSNRTP